MLVQISIFTAVDYGNTDSDQEKVVVRTICIIFHCAGLEQCMHSASGKNLITGALDL